MRLTNLTWPKAQEYFEKNDMVLISIGSIECHGRHMPLGTDTLIPEHLLEKIEKKSDVLIAPTIPYGSCQYLAPYPGTIDIDNEVLYQFCRQIFLSLYRHGARKFVFLNGHGGNIKMIERLGMEFEDKGCLVAMLNWWLMAWDMNPAWKGGHGGGEEADALKQGGGHVGDVARHHHDGHGFADGSAHAQHHGSGNAAFGGGDGDTEVGFLRRRAQGKGSVLVFLGNRLQGGDGHFDDGGQDHYGEDDDGGKQAGAVGNVKELPQSRHQHHHADEAVNHGGDTRQHGNRLLHEALDGLRRHFCQINRR